MKTETLPDWHAFESIISEIRQETEVLRRERALFVSDPLFRGQRNSEWHLETTLEREREGMSLSEYLGSLCQVHARVGLSAPARWRDLREEIDELSRRGLESIMLFPTVKSHTTSILSFMAYLRHHGFPSPLLDWSRSPYVAAFFAFEWADPHAKEVGIYVFREYTGATGDARDTHEPRAFGIGSELLGTSNRHVRQQSEYSLCVKKISSSPNLSSYIFASHEDSVNIPGFIIDGDRQLDVTDAENAVAKYTLPVGERNTALACLARMGITRQGLFDESVESLLEDLWHEAIVANR
ncbi:MAG: FRG domain-containing protein [Solirubrobacterales bacterium]